MIGSVARGNFNESSDIDVIIISDKIPKSYKNRGELLYEYVFDAIEPKGYTTDEFKFIYRKRNPIEAVSKGVLVHDDGIWKNILKDTNS
ncbi:nucleotidyltransferase domain-containing protein [Calorimonas adulescens]|uniref:nucleotidyltransferase domain-containing protein n=1 Tax=Calorimonas adulescens TaxID=2606906 RepID=UPI001EEFD2D6|nr:nucleotidyltransferase domain-containing protein [Calorimonas adulescens]